MESKRLHYTVITPEDADFFTKFYSSELLTNYLPKGRPYNREEIETLLENRLSHWKNYGFGTYILRLKSNGAIIGYCGLEHVYETAMVDIRYGITDQLWGQGLGFESAKTIVQHGFVTLGMKQIFGAAKHKNLPSMRILEKLGMLPFDGAQFFDDSSLQFFRITRQQYDQSTATSQQ